MTDPVAIDDLGRHVSRRQVRAGLGFWLGLLIVIVFTPVWGPILFAVRIAPDHFAYVAVQRGPHTTVYLSHADGAYPIDVSSSSWINRHPIWSPDGSMIAFESSRDGNLEIYLGDVRSQAVFNLTRHPAPDVAPLWSPDGRHIAFASHRDGRTAIYVYDRFGGGIARLSDVEGLTGDPGAYAWSPDGQQIAFITRGQDDTGFNAIHLLALHDGSHRLLYRAPGFLENLAWSPDGREIAFASNRDQHWAIYALAVPDETDAGDPQLRALIDDHTPAPLPFTARRLGNVRPAWSPDGGRILFEGWVDPVFRWDLFVMDADGSNIRNLTRAQGDDVNASWSPDGRRILFQSWRDGNSEIYALAVPGAPDQAPGRARRITFWNQLDWEPQWMPYSP